MEEKVVGEGLQSSGLAHREIADRAIGPTQHVLAARHAMDPSLQGLSRRVQRTARMSRVGAGAGNEPMIGEALGRLGFELGVRQAEKGVAHGQPRQGGRLVTLDLRCDLPQQSAFDPSNTVPVEILLLVGQGPR